MADLWTTDDREGWIRTNACRWLVELDPHLRSAQIEVAAVRHGSDRSDALLKVRQTTGAKIFEMGIEVPFLAGSGTGTAAPRPSRYFRREAAGAPWRPYQVAAGAQAATTPTGPAAPRSVPLSPSTISSSLLTPLAIVLICLGLYASAGPLKDIAKGVRSLSWQQAELLREKKTWLLVSPTDGARTEVAEPVYTVAKWRRSQAKYLAIFERSLGRWTEAKRPMKVYLDPAAPTKPVLVNGVPPQSVGILILTSTLLIMGLRLLAGLARGKNDGWHCFDAGRVPTLLIIPTVHLGLLAVYTLTAFLWSYLVFVPLPGWPALLCLAAAGVLEAVPGLWSWLYSFDRWRWFLFQLLLAALLPAGVILFGLGLPFLLATLAAFMLLMAVLALFRPSCLGASVFRLFWVPFYVAGLGAAFRALCALAYFLFPGIPYHQPAWLLGNLADVARFDVAVGAAGVVVVLGSTIADTFWRLRQVQQLGNLPTSKVHAAPLGIAEFRGVARSINPGEETVLSWDSSKRPETKPFYLEDSTGRILVDPGGAVFRTGRATSLAGRILEIVLTGRVTPAEIGRPLTMELRSGDEIYLIGTVMLNPSAAAEASGTDALVVKPLEQQGVADPFVGMLLGRSGLPPARDIHHVFFLSDGDERLARRHLMGGVKDIWAKAILMAALSLLLISLQFPRAGAGIASWSLGEILRAPLPPGEHMDQLVGHLLGESAAYRQSQSHWLRDVAHARELLRVKDLMERAEVENHLWSRVRNSPSPDLAPIMVRLLQKSREGGLRNYAAWALGRIAASPELAIPPLLDAVHDPSAEVRSNAAQSLAAVAPAGHPDVVPALLALLGDADPDVVRSALFSLRQLKAPLPDAALAPLIAMLNHSDQYLRHEAANVLGKIPQAAAVTLEPLRAALRDPEEIVRNSAAAAIGAMGPAGAAALPELIEALQDARHGTRQFAATALGQIGAAARDALPYLHRAAADENKWVRSEAESAIGRIRRKIGAQSEGGIN